VTEGEAPRVTLEETGASPSVQKWLDVQARHWNIAHSDDEVVRRVEVLCRFCNFAGTDPDTLVAGLFRDTPDGRKIKMKRRRAVMAMIEGFEVDVGEGDVRRGREQANLVRSFLIHNGVALTASPLR
jgi:hypothetical protein